MQQPSCPPAAARRQVDRAGGAKVGVAVLLDEPLDVGVVRPPWVGKPVVLRRGVLLPVQPDLARPLGEQVLLLETVRPGEAQRALAHQQHAVGAPHHLERDLGRVLDALERRDRAGAHGGRRPSPRRRAGRRPPRWAGRRSRPSRRRGRPPAARRRRPRRPQASAPATIRSTASLTAARPFIEETATGRAGAGGAARPGRAPGRQPRRPRRPWPLWR